MKYAEVRQLVRTLTVGELRELLEIVTFQPVAGWAAARYHGQRLVGVPENAWEALVIRHSPNVTTAHDPSELRDVMGNSGTYLLG